MLELISLLLADQIHVIRRSTSLELVFVRFGPIHTSSQVASRRCAHR